MIGCAGLPEGELPWASLHKTARPGGAARQAGPGPGWRGRKGAHLPPHPTPPQPLPLGSLGPPKQTPHSAGSVQSPAPGLPGSLLPSAAFGWGTAGEPCAQRTPRSPQSYWGLGKEPEPGTGGGWLHRTTLPPSGLAVICCTLMDPGKRLLGEFRMFPPLPHVGPTVGSCGWTQLGPPAGEPSQAMQEQGNTLRRTGLA
ncbi:protein enabled homolog [Gopherus evgoodei]|uniref:protein enabled homolog n=1 Tax=Gopherus evgoodei TaxID=1825980 RepID=UPI0011CEF7D6|nr:protein enabled homolog [Gopherus evgoodei]